MPHILNVHTYDKSVKIIMHMLLSHLYTCMLIETTDSFLWSKQYWIGNADHKTMLHIFLCERLFCLTRIKSERIFARSAAWLLHWLYILELTTIRPLNVIQTSRLSLMDIYIINISEYLSTESVCSRSMLPVYDNVYWKYVSYYVVKNEML